jgi:hypothetical protein
LLLLAAFPLVAQARPAPAAATGPGCDPTRPAVVHYAGGVALRPQPKNLPTPCGVSNGMPGNESRIGVTNAGTVLYYPAQQPVANVGGQDVYTAGAFGNPAENVGLARTENAGASWSAVRWPHVSNAKTPAPWPVHNMLDSQMFVDRASGVILMALFDARNEGDNSPLMRSTDDGKTWTAVLLCCGYGENPEFASAPPPPGGEKPTAGFKNVIYFCHNFNGTVQMPPGRACNKSLDGGATWSLPLNIVQPVIPGREECGGPTGVDTVPNWSYPQASPDGSLYMVVTCPDSTAYLSRSTDEATTWPIVQKLPHGGYLRVDGTGALYLARAGTNKAGTTLLLSHSTNQGRTWSPELNVLPPSVHQIPAADAGEGYGYGYLVPPGSWDITAARSGEVAFAYWTERKDGKLDGYLTQTRNALDPKPVFYSGMVNNPKYQLTNGSAPLDFLSVDIGPDGTAWGSYVHECRDGTPDAVCANTTTRNPYVGFAGRLAWSSGQGHSHGRSKAGTS